MIALFPWLLLSSTVSIFGDVLCKYAAKASYPNAVWLTVCAAIAWASLPSIWVHIYRSKSILEMVVAYSSFHAFALGLAGVLLFGDALTIKLLSGGLLSMLAIWVMT